MRSRIYNSPNPEMNFPISRVGWAVCVCLLLAQVSFAADWHQPISELAGKIATLTGPGVVALDVSNRSSIASAEVEEIRRELTTALSTAGVRVWQPDQAAAMIKLTLSENLQNYVWVAEIQQAANDNGIILVSSPRPDTAIAQQQNVPPLTLRATALISRPQPILDVALLTGIPQRIFVLTRSEITLQELQSGHWNTLQSMPITSPNPLPRDARGHIILRKDHLFDTYLPGLICHSNNSAPLAMSCAPSDDPWPLGAENFGLSAFFSPTRNFFTGALVPGIGKQKSAPPFYSAAALPRSNYVLWAFAGLDGQVHLLDGFNQQVLSKVRWGSDLAAVHAACRQDWQVLADTSESETSDSLQLFEFADREPAAVSPKLALNGRVTALWAAPDGENAIAAFQNSSTGNYEAVQLNFDCAR
ncbi:MAG TPA: hypothetical protein VFA90_08395 [Terriglobales bacterium]|nr:hypothetical protein [Terriglobales bacterium]